MNRVADPNDMLKQFHMRERAAIEGLIEAAQSGDVDRFASLFGDMGGTSLTTAVRSIVKGPELPNEIKSVVLNMWVNDSASFRDDFNNELLLLDFLWKSLPPYLGGPKELYRGDSFHNRRRRTYGMSWSSSRKIAKEFAIGGASLYLDGTVLLKSIVPSEAIIVYASLYNDVGEEEYIVDRRKLLRVEVLERFKPMGDFEVVSPIP